MKFGQCPHDLTHVFDGRARHRANQGVYHLSQLFYEETWMVSTPPWWLELNPEPGEAVLVTFEPVVGM